MNNFFCEIPLTGSPHSTQIRLDEVFSQKFPYQSGPCSTYHTPQIYLWGNTQVSTLEGHSTLYVVGEIYNLHNLGKAINLPVAAWSAAKILHELIAQQGTGVISQCNGRFFVLIYHVGSHTVEVFNDQMGIQQVYYHQDAEGIIMASELKFLLAHPRCPQRIDWGQSIRRSLAFNVIDHCQHQNAWFEGVEMLPPASRMWIQPQPHQNRIQIASYWQPTFSPQPYEDARQVMDAYMDLLDDAVQIRCHDSDEAYSFLSGGLDSSIICALAAQRKPLNTYSIVTQTTYLEQTTEICFNLADYLRCHNTQVVMPYHRIALDPLVWKKRLWRAESPAAHTDSITKTLLHYSLTNINPNAHYTLTGTGSDQFNGGLTRWLVNDDEQNPDNNWSNLIAKLDDEALRPLIPEHHSTQWGLRHLLHTTYINSLGKPAFTPNDWMFYVRNNLYINQYSLLWDENRAGSSQNRSVRYPFLDYRFLEFIGNIPTQFHPQLFYDKQILRSPAARYLPDYIINKPKVPTNTGDYDNRIEQYRAFVSDNHRAVAEELLANNAVIGTLISRHKLQAEIERLEKTDDLKAWQYLLHLLNLGVLEKLPLQTETSMRYENIMDQGSMVVHTLDAVTIAQIEAKLDMVTQAEKEASILAFRPGSSLVIDRFSNALFLVKDNVMQYEIDEAELNWKQFLLQIDGQKTVSEILAQQGIVYGDVQLYLEQCMKEGFLGLVTTNRDV